MKTRSGAFFTMAVLGGIVAWRNRFTFQRQLKSRGFKTPIIKDNLEDTARSVADQAKGRMERGATIAEDFINKKAG